MKNLANQSIQKMTTYSPPLEGRSVFKGLLMDFNERTVPVDAKVRQAIQKFVSKGNFNIYPDYSNLSENIAKYVGVSAGQVLITNGSDQAIDIIFRTFTQPEDKVIIPSPSFAMFYQSAQLAKNHLITPFYQKDDLSFPTQKILDSIDKKVKLIVICNPNNPTGTPIRHEDIEKILLRAPDTIVYVDEAYFEFSRLTAIDLLGKYPNLIVSRTFSKAFGLGALRIGYAVASSQYIAEMTKVRGPYDVNMVALVAAKAVLNERRETEKYSSEVMNKAKPLLENFFRENNVTFYPSSANFILFKPKYPKKVFNLLQDNGVLIRPQNKSQIKGTIRITIGTTKQIKKVIDLYRKIILQKYAFLDRDGTLIYEPQDTYQIDSLEKLRILDGVISGLKSLKKNGYKLIMVTNQDGLGTESFSRSEFDKPHQKMLKVFKNHGVEFDKIFICPHLPQDECDCRKPKIGLLKPFLRQKKGMMDMKRSFVCGDRPTDRQLARNLNISFVPMQTNGSFEEAINKLRKEME